MGMANYQLPTSTGELMAGFLNHQPVKHTKEEGQAIAFDLDDEEERDTFVARQQQIRFSKLFQGLKVGFLFVPFQTHLPKNGTFRLVDM